uniref:Uncharacterized protein n=1 Tax=Anguilla anguilla TaxID=7936 RepID=A0A0E9XP64_ANGAN
MKRICEIFVVVVALLDLLFLIKTWLFIMIYIKCCYILGNI